MMVRYTCLYRCPTPPPKHNLINRFQDPILGLLLGHVASHVELCPDSRLENVPCICTYPTPVR